MALVTATSGDWHDDLLAGPSLAEQRRRRLALVRSRTRLKRSPGSVRYCDGSCANLDFTMECELDDSETELECEGDGMWKDYEFEWERD